MTESKPISAQTQQTYPLSIDVATASVQATSLVFRFRQPETDSTC
jgi:hypothetical protein